MSKTDTITEIFPAQIAELKEIERDVTTTYRLADAIREGASVTEKAQNWGSAGKACALTAAAIATKARRSAQ